MSKDFSSRHIGPRTNQIQEMLFIEKGDKNQAYEEIESYNSLVP